MEKNYFEEAFKTNGAFYINKEIHVFNESSKRKFKLIIVLKEDYDNPIEFNSFEEFYKYQYENKSMEQYIDETKELNYLKNEFDK